ncbi:MBOAT family protein [Ancylostoma caninum]|uniref:Lysophospholipid acyltransferase 5 n=1 Tax=Ancylostoma caninum TaxID=29170 RepID=A0A368GPM9_ANCCA|nr:MBOAT family protein [Ancylostoma caninum]
MVVGTLADLLNAREDGLRLLLCVLAGYPLAVIHRSFLYNKPANVQHAAFVAIGLTLYIFNSGFNSVHALIAILMAYGITNFIGGTRESVIAAHICFLGYLLVGYWYVESEAYDITWTTPYCIMTLRFTGLVMDIYDGAHFETLKADQKKTAIKEKPGLLEIAAFGLFYTGTFAGPQFTLSKFRAYVNGDWLDENGQPKQSALMPSLGRFIGGCTYMVLNQWGAVWIPDMFFNSQEFFEMSFFWRWTWTTIWFRLTMYRYCAMWLITEGAAILNGLGYNGKDKDGNDRWDCVRDVHVWLWETGHDFSSAIASFNCGTNTFAKNHIFRRLRWLGSKAGAHLTTLGYLAIWHGYHLGYFLLFFFEFGCMVAQEQLYALIDRTPGWAEFNAKPAVRPFIWLFGRLTVMYSMGFGFLCFGLVKTKFWIGPLKSLYFVGFVVFFVVWPIVHYVLKKSLPRKPKAASPEQKSSAVPENKKEL